MSIPQNASSNNSSLFDHDDHKVDWRSTSLSKILEMRLGKPVAELEGGVLIYSLFTFPEMVKIHRKCHFWRYKQYPEPGKLGWYEYEGRPKEDGRNSHGFQGWNFSGVSYEPLPVAIMQAVMYGTGWISFPFPWFVGQGCLTLIKTSPSKPHIGFFPGRCMDSCFLFVDMGFTF